MTGSWKSFEEMEECLTLEELYSIIEGGREREHRSARTLGIIMHNVDIDAKSDKAEYTPEKEIEFFKAAGISYESDGEIE